MGVDHKLSNRQTTCEWRRVSSLCEMNTQVTLKIASTPFAGYGAGKVDEEQICILPVVRCWHLGVSITEGVQKIPRTGPPRCYTRTVDHGFGYSIFFSLIDLNKIHVV